MATRFKTKFTGVSYRISKKDNGKTTDKIFYIFYKHPDSGKFIEEPVGRESHGMTAAKANIIKGLRAAGKEPSNKDKRQNIRKKDKINLKYLWDKYAYLNAKRKSLEDDSGRIKHFIHLLNKPISEMTTNDIDLLKKKIHKAPGTINQVLALIKRLINFGVNRGMCKYPENLHIKMLKVSKNKTEFLSDDETKRLLNVLDELGNIFEVHYLKLAMYTGMRKNALLALKWSDCDFDNKIIHLSSKYAKSGDISYIPMSNLVKDILLSIKKTDSEFVFPDKNGQKRTNYNYHFVKKIYKKAGIEDFRPLHGLRHNFASRLASSGKVDLYTIQKLLTHKEIKMTQRYAHLRDEALRRAANVVDEEFL